MAGVLKTGGITTMGLGKGADGKVAVRVERGKMDEACRALGRTRRFTVEGPPLDMTADEVVRSLGEQGWQAEAKEARESRRGKAVWLVEALTAPPAMDLEVEGELWLVSQSMSAGVARGTVWDGSRSFMKGWETGRKEVQPTTGQGRVFRKEEFPVLGRAAQPAKNEGAKNGRGGGWGNVRPGAAGGAESPPVALEEVLKGLFEGLATKLTACLTSGGERDTGRGGEDTKNGAEVVRQREQIEEMRKEMLHLRKENEELKNSLAEMKEMRKELDEQRRENEEIRETVRECKEHMKQARPAQQKGGKDAEMGSQASSEEEEGAKRKKQKGGNAKGKQK
ncbi:hypothetical protein DIPPA_27775 [Diplonema papillatum]|nr:hypothetical protein DIPPA_27775 [Diplonema papillatum]